MLTSHYGKRWSGSARSREPQTGLRHRKRLLELNLFGGGKRSRQALLRAPPRLLCTFDRDLVSVLGDVREHCDSVGQHLEEASTDEEDLLRASLRLLNPQRSRLQDRHQWRVPREDSELSSGAVGDEKLDIALVEASLDAHHPKGKFHCDADFFFMSSPCARASSMVPTM